MKHSNMEKWDLYDKCAELERNSLACEIVEEMPEGILSAETVSRSFRNIIRRRWCADYSTPGDRRHARKVIAEALR